MSVPPAEKPGRNEPCWCGSGKKYKHCHLRQDEEAAHPAVPPMRQNETGGERGMRLSPEQAAAEAEWRRFEHADMEGKCAIFQQRTAERRLDKEEVFEMLLPIRDESNPRYDAAARVQFKALVDRLQESLPEVYHEERGFLLECLIKDAIADQVWTQVPEWLGDLAEMAANKIDEFFDVVYPLLYLGQTESLFAALRTAWAKVHNSPEVLPSGAQELFGILLDLNLFRYLETTPHPRADDPALLEPVREFGAYYSVWLHTAVAHLSAPAPSSWKRTDFDRAVDAETWEQNLAALLFEFMAERRRASGVPLSRSNLMQTLLQEVLHQQFTQTGLEPPRQGKRKVKPPTLPPSPTLIPKFQLLDSTLTGKFSLFDSES